MPQVEGKGRLAKKLNRKILKIRRATEVLDGPTNPQLSRKL